MPTDEHPNRRLHFYDVLTPQISSHLLEISDLACPEEDLRVSVAELVLVLEPVPHDVLARRLDIPVDDLRPLTQQPVAVIKVVVAPSRRETRGGNSNSLQDAASPQLLHNLASFPSERMLVVVGLDTPDVVGRRRVKCRDKLREAFAELRADSLFVLFRGKSLRE